MFPKGNGLLVPQCRLGRREENVAYAKFTTAVDGRRPLDSLPMVPKVKNSIVTAVLEAVPEGVSNTGGVLPVRWRCESVMGPRGLQLEDIY